MKYQIARPAFRGTCGTLCLLCFLLLSVLPVTSHAQVELRADKQILLEATHGTQTIKEGPGNKLYVLTRSVKPPSSLWMSDYSGSSIRQILNGGSEPTDLLRFPKDFAVDRDGNAIVVDAGLIKTFSPDGKLLSSFPSDRPQSVAAVDDGRILVSGLPKDDLISVFDRRGTLLGHIGETVKIDDAPGPGFNAVFNIGTIVVDDDNNIYYVFRHLLTPTVRKYAPQGNLVAEWHPKSTHLDQAVSQAKKAYEAHKERGNPGGAELLTAGAFDTETKTLWVASGSEVLQLDNSGETIRSFSLVRPEGGPVQAFGLLVDRDFIRAAGPLNGTFEFFKPH
jgi:DNA-binding beta-propeller fold protein YncE